MVRRLAGVWVLIFSLILSIAVFAQTDNTAWKTLKGYWPGGPLTMDTEHVDYNKATDSAAMWVKWTFKDGSVRRNHYLIDFSRATLCLIYSGEFNQDGSLHREFKGEQEPFPVRPDSWQEQACDIIAQKVGRHPIYGETLQWKQIGLDETTHDRVFIGENTTTYIPEESVSYVWIMINKATGYSYKVCYKCQFLSPYLLGKADGTWYPEMAPPDSSLEQIVIRGARQQYRMHEK